MLSIFRLASVGLLAILALPVSAETVLLKNGFRMKVERHEAESGMMHLYMQGGGVVHMNASEIDSVEQDEPVIPDKPAPEKPAVTDIAPRVTLDDLIKAASARHGLDPDLIRSMIAAESAGNPRAVSPKGATGLMQLMPGTAKILGITNPFDPATNVEGGTAYIRQLLDRYGRDLQLALAAYNAGPGKVESYRGLPPYRETYSYITRVITKFNKEKAKQAAAK